MNDLAERFYMEINEAIDANRLVLPILPEVALEVRRVVESDDAGAADVAAAVCTDPALTARLLSVVNSPLYRGREPIQNVQHAVSRLGMHIVRNLVLSIIVKQMFHSSNPVTARRMQQVWNHSTQVAGISYALAAQFTELEPNQALLAGLIHDIGTIPLIGYAERYPEIVNNAAFMDHVVESLHTLVGRSMLARWQLDPELVEVAGEHEDLARPGAGFADLVDIVMVANLQSHLGTGHPHAALDWGTVPAVARLGLDPEINVVDIPGIAESSTSVEQMLAM